MTQPVLDGHIGISDGWDVAQEFLLLKLLTHFNATKDDLFNVTEVDGNKYTEDGYYLPDVRTWYWHAGPSPQEVTSQIGQPSGFVGPVADTARAGGLNLLADSKNGYHARLPFGLAIAFDGAPNEPVKCPVEVAVKGEPDARFLTAKEILVRRATKYLGALKHTIHERCGLAPACLRAVITSDYTLAGALRVVDIESTDQTTRPVALIFVEILADQEQYTPKYAKTP